MLHSEKFANTIRKILEDCLQRHPNEIITTTDMTDEMRGCLNECIQEGYLSGGVLHNDRTADGVLHILVTKPFVTKKGREFLDQKHIHDNSKMITILLSFIAVLFAFLTNMVVITDNIKALFSIIL